ncbi:CHP02436-containing protein [Emticicia oligotrophica DSM 17448]|uniref:CHP02436-containing protein n=1 Tax=Emticicia oligotrophica (strain DSM 17448 / CIP 109782 / MTCC 6937 / GPTSA100-15) TaxID=929562 RepID=A0ABM5MZN2_EMTOG|nr:four helix bundle protein [Emticicia oligotrophica]AFK02658.1 CHP02436-containing protein [Emticicia oligotrophica DSM 17448]
MRNDKENLIINETLQFSIKIIKYCEVLEQNRKIVIAKQLLRAGTSIGANVWEAQNAESKADFIHKMKIACKEADEVKYWLKICELADSYISPDIELVEDLERINRILSKIVSSSKG